MSTRSAGMLGVVQPTTGEAGSGEYAATIPSMSRSPGNRDPETEGKRHTQRPTDQAVEYKGVEAAGDASLRRR